MSLKFDRIRHLLSPETLEHKHVLQVGLGSGGAPVSDHLTMNGVKWWTLYDPETLDEVNLVKHPRGRSGLGYAKVALQREWIIDRNPDADVIARTDDVFTSPTFHEDAAECDLILSCTDKRSVRLFINDVAVKLHKPCITASVFRRGFGGEVYCYIPGFSGCFECMDNFAERSGLNINAKIDPNETERETIYGRSIQEFQASGLSIDIQMISLLQARLALELLLSPVPQSGNLTATPWIIFHNRPLAEGADGFLQARRFILRPQVGCQCAAF